MDDSKHIDIYCERLDASFWAEPLNAITNLAFLAGALAAYLLWRKSARKPENLVLITVAGAVGVGSFAFHTFANLPSMLADVIPIIIFIHLAFLLVMRRILGFSWMRSILFIILFVGVNFLVNNSPFSGALNGSMQYVTALIGLFAVAIFACLKNKPGAKLFFLAGAVFAVSLTFRNLDMAICEIFPPGSHFMWHLLNPVTMYLAMRVLIIDSKAGRKKRK